jgi:archaeosortase C (PEF-CTERM variant)
MALSWEGLVKGFNGIFPEGSPRKKLLTIISIILLFEGISVMLLFSKAGLAAGIFSLALGAFLLLLLNPGTSKKIEPAAAKASREARGDPIGLRVVDAVVKTIDNDYIVMATGGAIIILVVIWNVFFSANPKFGDYDTLTMIFGGMILVYPLIAPKFRVEAAFSLLFIGLVVLFLVVPQVFMSTNSERGSAVGNWYVHYMLAAPFSHILDLIGIQSSSTGNVVVIQFHDGSAQALGISAYCAGLYSFSIFLAAFFSFILVFERLPPKVLAGVLAVGLIIAYLGNLFRMVIIGVVGYYKGLDALLWAHKNVGWVLFLGWSAIFWYLVIRYADKRGVSAGVKTH